MSSSGIDSVVRVVTAIDPHPTDGRPAAEARPAPPSPRPDPPSRFAFLSGPAFRGPAGALVVYAISRVVVLIGLIPAMFASNPGAGPWPGLPAADRLSLALSRWDGAWYLWVAARGYPNAAHLNDHLSDVAFYPLYPALLRVGGDLTGLPLPYVAVCLSAVLGAASAVLIWHLAARITDGRVADRAVLLYVVFPGTFALSLAYAEGLMIVAAAACLLFLLDRRWLLAGVAAAVAGATRPNALAVLVACAVVAVVEIVRRREWRALLAPAVGSVGALGYQLFLWVHTGELRAWFRAERDMWHDHPVFTPGPVWRRIAETWHASPLSLQSGRLNAVVGDIGLLLVIAGLFLIVRVRPPLPVAVYTAAALLIPLTSTAIGARPRMVLAAFPVAILAATVLSGRALRIAVGLSVVGLLALTVLTGSTLAATP